MVMGGGVILHLLSFPDPPSLFVFIVENDFAMKKIISGFISYVLIVNC